MVVDSKAIRFGAVVMLFALGWLRGGPGLRAAPASNATVVVELHLNDYVRTVLRHNDDLQAQMLLAGAKEHEALGERGIFEPELKASILREINKRTNNIQQQASLAGQSFFSERNTIYDGGLETLIPTGAKIRLGYTLSDFVNNVNPYYGILGGTNVSFIQQYQTFVGATFTQPLLKNAGLSATLAPLRLAALDSAIAFQQYRRQLMVTVAQAESAYWNLYFAQEQVRFFDKSIAAAREVLNDSRARVKAGQAAELDVLEAQSALALRNTKRNQAVQGYDDALGQLRTLAGTVPIPNLSGSSGPELRAVDAPPETNSPLSYARGFQAALASSPDLLIRREKMKQEGLRLGYAKNQLLPELDLKAAYGYNGLGLTPGDSWAVAQSQDYPSWSVGLELTMPLAGNIQGRHDLKAAKLGLQAAYAKLQAAETQIGENLQTSIQKTRSWRRSLQSYQTVVQYNQALLGTELARLKAGTVDAHKVLEVEADLLDARQDLADALVEYRKSLLQVQVTDGSILKRWHLEVTRDQLRQQTDGWLRRAAARQRAFAD